MTISRVKRAFRIDAPFLFQESRFQTDFFYVALPIEINELLSIRDAPDFLQITCFLVLNKCFFKASFCFGSNNIS